MKLEHIPEIVSIYESKQNPELAERMSAYMKHNFKFLGIPSPLRSELNKDIFALIGKMDIVNIEPIVEALWQLPEREYQYLALVLIDKVKKKLTPSHLEFFIELILEKSWWDTIDAIAPNYIGYIMLQYPELREEYIPAWVRSNNFWINRTALLFQLKYKKDTDFELLKSCIEPLKTQKEFFVKKAIGWALREYSKTNPEMVKDYISTANLQALSKKEGLKHMIRQQNI